VLCFERAVYAYTKADLIERYAGADATGRTEPVMRAASCRTATTARMPAAPCATSWAWPAWNRS
jgi:hypothetical protein